MSTRSFIPADVSWLQMQSAKWKKDITFVLHQIRTLSQLLKHPNVPWHAKAVAGCAVAYLLSPIQLIPTFIPVIGQMDDLLVLFLGMKLVRKLTPAEIVAECEAKARTPMTRIPVATILVATTAPIE
jgi:uncharacterized membrane protein YkvA (DUF1232 family)